jgi:uncharacterized membrane protein YphA (DoxX/SURF4 family)
MGGARPLRPIPARQQWIDPGSVSAAITRMRPPQSGQTLTKNSAEEVSPGQTVTALGANASLPKLDCASVVAQVDGHGIAQSLARPTGVGLVPATTPPGSLSAKASTLKTLRHVIDRFRARRWAHLFVVNLRILLGFAFVPAGLKKVLGQPFTDPQNTGTFHEFLHVFHATGVFYQFVGFVQLLFAVLLMTQTLATLGALTALPVITCITVFCWSTGVIPTAVVATLMLCGTLVLCVWDVDRWPAVVDRGAPAPARARTEPPIDPSLWRACGTLMLVFYGFACVLYGGVYRPKGLDLGEPAFYALPVLSLFPFVTWAVEQRRRSRTSK